MHAPISPHSAGPPLFDVAQSIAPIAGAALELVMSGALQVVVFIVTAYYLVIDGRRRLKGIFTGRDAVRLLGRSKNPAAAVLSRAMRRDPSAVTRTCTAIDALHIMNDGGFRHLPVVEDGRVLGIVTRRDFTAVEIDQLDQEEHLKECIW